MWFEHKTIFSTLCRFLYDFIRRCCSIIVTTVSERKKLKTSILNIYNSIFKNFFIAFMEWTFSLAHHIAILQKHTSDNYVVAVNNELCIDFVKHLTHIFDMLFMHEDVSSPQSVKLAAGDTREKLDEVSVSSMLWFLRLCCLKYMQYITALDFPS